MLKTNVVIWKENTPLTFVCQMEGVVEEDTNTVHVMVSSKHYDEFAELITNQQTVEAHADENAWEVALLANSTSVKPKRRKKSDNT